VLNKIICFVCIANESPIWSPRGNYTSPQNVETEIGLFVHALIIDLIILLLLSFIVSNRRRSLFGFDDDDTVWGVKRIIARLYFYDDTTPSLSAFGVSPNNGVLY